MSNEKPTFAPREYVLFMPVVATDQFRGRLHKCPLCGRLLWSCFAHADRHWQAHINEEEFLENKKATI